MDLFFQLLPIITTIVLIFIGMFAGYFNEKSHYTSIKQRETAFAKQPCLTTKTLPSEMGIGQAHMVYGSVVISVDHWKRLLAGIRGIFGGEVKAYSSLVDRARREATLRMKELAPDADLFINYRIETSTISNGKGKTVATVEALAFATAIKKV